MSVGSASSCSPAPTASSTSPGRSSSSAARRELLWHGDRDRPRRRRGRGARRVRARRLPAHRRHRPVLAGDGRGRRARRRRRSGRRHLQRLPGAHRGRPAPRRAAEERRAHVPVRDRRARGREHRDRCSPAWPSAGRRAAHPDQPLRGQLRVRSRHAARGCATTTASSLRYVDNPNGSLDDIAGISNEAGNVVGLMPHPERASDAAPRLAPTASCCCSRSSRRRERADRRVNAHEARVIPAFLSTSADTPSSRHAA